MIRAIGSSRPVSLALLVVWPIRRKNRTRRAMDCADCGGIGELPTLRILNEISHAKPPSLVNSTLVSLAPLRLCVS